jgi:DUF4097 and DUF4098 domain-containing protein YvlB
MKKLFVLSVIVLLSTPLFVNAQNNNEPFAILNFPPSVASSIKSIEVTTSNAGISVNGNSAMEAVVEMYVSPSNNGIFNLWGSLSNRKKDWSDEDIKQTLEEDYIIDINVKNGKLYAIAKPKNKVQQKLNISFKISVPKHVNGNLHTSNGRIQMRNLSGSQSFRTSNASVTIENISSRVTGSTSNGSITIANSNNQIDLKTSNGRISVKNCSGNITLKTSNGQVDLSNLKGIVSVTTSNGSVTANNISGEFRVGTSNGRVKLDDVSGNVNVRTSNGEVNVAMNSVRDHVVLSTSNGSVNLSVPAKDYDLKAKGKIVKTSGLANFSGKIDNRILDGKTGNGGAKIELHTSGRVNLSFN